ncbi:hypothetical protein D3C79_937150 [compost metagenome]
MFGHGASIFTLSGPKADAQEQSPSAYVGMISNRSMKHFLLERRSPLTYLKNRSAKT